VNQSLPVVNQSLSIGVELPEAYTQLKKLMSAVRRPYHSQTLVLNAQCFVLANHFAKDHNKTADNLIPLNAAIQDAKKAIDAAIAAVTSIGPFEHNIQTHAVGRAFQSAENKIQECFKQYGLMKEWATQKKIEAAVKEDKARVDQMNARVAKSGTKGNPSHGPPTIKVKILVPSRQTYKSEYVVDDTTRLSGIMWKETTKDATLLQGFKLALPSTTDPLKGTSIPFDKEFVKDIPMANDGTRTLWLVQAA